MKLLPDLLNDSLDDVFNNAFFANAKDEMKTDIHEDGNMYILSMELPGFKKENIHLILQKGYLTIEAIKEENIDEQDKNENIIRQERFHGTCKRSFYVGEYLEESDIHANLDNGELIISFPKKIEKKVQESRFIPIE